MTHIEKRLRLTFTSKMRRHSYNVYLKPTQDGWEATLYYHTINADKDGKLIMSFLHSVECNEFSEESEEAFINAWNDLSMGENSAKVNIELQNELDRTMEVNHACA